MKTAHDHTFRTFKACSKPALVCVWMSASFDRAKADNLSNKQSGGEGGDAAEWNEGEGEEREKRRRRNTN